MYLATYIWRHVPTGTVGKGSRRCNHAGEMAEQIRRWNLQQPERWAYAWDGELVSFIDARSIRIQGLKKNSDNSQICLDNRTARDYIIDSKQATNQEPDMIAMTRTLTTDGIVCACPVLGKIATIYRVENGFTENRWRIPHKGKWYVMPYAFPPCDRGASFNSLEAAGQYALALAFEMHHEGRVPAKVDLSITVKVS